MVDYHPGDYVRYVAPIMPAPTEDDDLIGGEPGLVLSEHQFSMRAEEYSPDSASPDIHWGWSVQFLCRHGGLFRGFFEESDLKPLD